jgi:hypothetical protein
MGRQSVTVMSDYVCGWPLWLDGVGLVGDDFARERGLDPQLCRDLVAVQDFFDERFHWDKGWREPGDEPRYAELMVDAFFRLRRELGDAWLVGLDLWPVTDDAILLRLHRTGVLPPATRRRT